MTVQVVKLLALPLILDILPISELWLYCSVLIVSNDQGAARRPANRGVKVFLSRDFKRFI